MIEAQRKMLTYLLVRYGQGRFCFPEWHDALVIVFDGWFVRRDFEVSITECKFERWLDECTKPFYGYKLTDKALKELQDD